MSKGFTQDQDPIQKLTESFGKLSAEVSNLYSMFSHLSQSIQQIDKLATRVTFQMLTMAGLHQPIPYGIRDVLAKGFRGSHYGHTGIPGYGRGFGRGGFGGYGGGGPYVPPSGPSGRDSYTIVPVEDLYNAASAKVSSSMNPSKGQQAKDVLSPGPSYQDSARSRAGKDGNINQTRDEIASDKIKEAHLNKQSAIGEINTARNLFINQYNKIIESFSKSRKAGISSKALNSLSEVFGTIFPGLNSNVSLDKMDSFTNLFNKAVQSTLPSFKGDSKTPKSEKLKQLTLLRSLFEKQFEGFIKEQEEIFNKVSNSEYKEFSKSDTKTYVRSTSDVLSNNTNPSILNKGQKYRNALLRRLGFSEDSIKEYSQLQFMSNVPWATNVEGMSQGKDAFIHPDLRGKDLVRVTAHETFHNLTTDKAGKPINMGKANLSDWLWAISHRAEMKSKGILNPTGLDSLRERRAMQFGEIESKSITGSMAWNSWSAAGKWFANAFAFHLKGLGLRRLIGMEPKQGSYLWSAFKNIQTDERGNPVYKPGSLASHTWHNRVGESIGTPFLAGVASIAGLLKAGSPDALHTFIDTSKLTLGKVGSSLIGPSVYASRQMRGIGNWWDNRSDSFKENVGWGVATTVAALGTTLIIAKLGKAATAASAALSSLRASAKAGTLGKGGILGSMLLAGAGAAIISSTLDTYSPNRGPNSGNSETYDLLEFAGLTAGLMVGQHYAGKGISKLYNRAIPPKPTPGFYPKDFNAFPKTTPTVPPVNPNVAKAGFFSRAGSFLGRYGSKAAGSNPLTALALGVGLDMTSDVYNMIRGKKSYMKDDILPIPKPTTGFNWWFNARDSLKDPNEKSGYFGRLRKEATRDIGGMAQSLDPFEKLSDLGDWGVKQLGYSEEDIKKVSPYMRYLNPTKVGARLWNWGERQLGLSESFNKDGSTPDAGLSKGQKEEARKKLEESLKEDKLKLNASLDAARIEPQFMGIEDVWKSMQLSVLKTPAEQEQLSLELQNLGILLERIASSTEALANNPAIRP